MKKYSKNVEWLRVFLGVFLIVYALNKFFHFFPSSYGQMPKEAEEFLDSTLIFLPFLFIFEIIIGLFLVFNKWPAAIYIVLFPNCFFSYFLLYQQRSRGYVASNTCCYFKHHHVIQRKRKVQTYVSIKNAKNEHGRRCKSIVIRIFTDTQK